MTDSGIAGLILIIANFAFSYKGFNDHSFFNKYKFEVDQLLVHKDYKRLVTSGFLHVNWMHLIFNMISLYIFSGPVEAYLGPINFLIIYFASLIGGDLFSLLVHKNHSDYSSVGASGAICGVIFACIALFPGMGVGHLLFPVNIPGWLYGILYVGISIYGIKSGKDNIGHEAHLGGALVGMLLAILIHPAALMTNLFTILLITIPAIAFIYIIITRPHVLLIDNFFFKTHRYANIDEKYNAKKQATQQEIDRILDKISRRGMESLSVKEKQMLEEYSRM